MKSIYAIALAATAGILAMGCDKKVVTQLDTDPVAGLSNLKIIYASAYTVNYSAQLKVNDTRVSNNITNTTPFPGGGLNTGGSSSPWYLALPGGATKITLSVPKAGSNIDSIMLYSGTVALTNNDYYSAYLTDTLTKTQIVFVKDDITTPSGNTSQFKFVNLMPNQPAGLDLYWGQNKVASNIQYTSVSPTFLLNRGDTAHWYIRTAGTVPTPTNYIAIYPTTIVSSFTIPVQRVMTVFSRGYSGATGNKAPNVSLLYNN